MLDLIQYRLSQAGVKCVKLDGHMTVRARDKAIDAFMNKPDVQVSYPATSGVIRVF